MEIDSLEEGNTPIKGESKIQNLGKRIFSLFKKKVEGPEEEEYSINEEYITETYSLLDDDMGKVAQAVKNIVAQELEYDADEIYPEHNLREKLWADEKNIANIMREIQDILKIPTEKRAIETPITEIRDIIKYVETHR